MKTEIIVGSVFTLGELDILCVTPYERIDGRCGIHASVSVGEFRLDVSLNQAKGLVLSLEDAIKVLEEYGKKEEVGDDSQRDA